MTQPEECLLCAASYGPRAGEEARAFATSQTSARLVHLPLGGLAGLWDGVPRLSHSCRSSKPHVTGEQADTSLLWQMWTQPPEALQCEGTAGAGAALATPAARPSWALLGPAHTGTAERAQQGAKRQHGDSKEMNNSLPDTLHLFLEGPHARKPRGLVFSLHGWDSLLGAASPNQAPTPKGFGLGVSSLRFTRRTKKWRPYQPTTNGSFSLVLGLEVCRLSEVPQKGPERS